MANRYWVGGSGTWDASDTSHWSASSGGASGASVPSGSDSVYFDASSFSTAGQTVTVGADITIGTLIWTGVTNTPTLTSSSGVKTFYIYGTTTFVSGMVVTPGTISFDFTYNQSHVILAEHEFVNISISLLNPPIIGGRSPYFDDTTINLSGTFAAGSGVGGALYVEGLTINCAGFYATRGWPSDIRTYMANATIIADTVSISTTVYSYVGSHIILGSSGNYAITDFPDGITIYDVTFLGDGAFEHANSQISVHNLTLTNQSVVLSADGLVNVSGDLNIDGATITCASGGNGYSQIYKTGGFTAHGTSISKNHITNENGQVTSDYIVIAGTDAGSNTGWTFLPFEPVAPMYNIGTEGIAVTYVSGDGTEKNNVGTEGLIKNFVS